jgi:hypothetical protein
MFDIFLFHVYRRDNRWIFRSRKNTYANLLEPTMLRYDVVTWPLGVPLLAHSVSLQNDHQAIGFAYAFGLMMLDGNVAEAADTLGSIHVHRASPTDSGNVIYSKDTFVAALLPATSDGEAGFRLNHPEGRGQPPQDRDLWP